MLWLRSFLEVVRVRALVGLERVEEARTLADAEVVLHERRGALGHQAMARLSRALVVGGDGAVAELLTAADHAGRSSMRIAEAHVLAELGDRFFYRNDPVPDTIRQSYGGTYRHTLAELIKLDAGVTRRANVFKAG